MGSRFVLVLVTLAMAGTSWTALAASPPIDETLTLSPQPLLAPNAPFGASGSLRGTLFSLQFVSIQIDGAEVALAQTDVWGSFSPIVTAPRSGTYTLTADYGTLGAAGVSAHASRVIAVAWPPDVPAGLTATPAPTALAADLAWTAVAPNATAPLTAYRIYQKTSTSPWTLVATTTSASARVAAAAGSLPSYRVTAYGLGGESAPSNSASIAMNPPTAPVVSVVATVAGARVSWNTTTGAQAFFVYRTVAGGSRVTVGQVGGNVFDITDPIETQGDYTYDVDAQNLAGTTRGSVTAHIVPLNMPANFTARAFPNPRVLLSWSPPEDGRVVLYYRLYRENASGAFARIADVHALTFNDVNVTARSTYRYQLDAIAGLSHSPTSPTQPVSVYVPIPLRANVPSFSYCWNATPSDQCGTTTDGGVVNITGPHTFRLRPTLSGQADPTIQASSGVDIHGNADLTVRICGTARGSGCDPATTTTVAWTAPTDGAGIWNATLAETTIDVPADRYATFSVQSTVASVDQTTTAGAAVRVGQVPNVQLAFIIQEFRLCDADGCRRAAPNGELPEVYESFTIYAQLTARATYDGVPTGGAQAALSTRERCIAPGQCAPVTPPASEAFNATTDANGLLVVWSPGYQVTSFQTWNTGKLTCNNFVIDATVTLDMVATTSNYLEVCRAYR